MVNLSEILNTDLGSVGIVGNIIAGFGLIIFAVVVKLHTNLVRVDYANFLATLLILIGTQMILDVANAPSLILSCIEVMQATLTVALIILLLRDNSLEG